MNNLEKYTEKNFEDIKHLDEYGNEYWEARELMPLLEYSKWENFHKVIKRAMIACETSNNNIFDHFPEFRKPIIGGKGNVQKVIDYKLSRYACYLIVQNANPRKKSVALGQTYFAIQTRKQEITELEYSRLSEDKKGYIVESKQKMVIKSYIKLQKKKALKTLIDLLMLAIEVFMAVKMQMLLLREKT